MYLRMDMYIQHTDACMRLDVLKDSITISTYISIIRLRNELRGGLRGDASPGSTIYYVKKY